MALRASQNHVWHATRYRIEREVARGGMGIVYRAFDRLTRRTVALKRILSTEADDGPERSSGEVAFREAPTKRLSVSATIPSLAKGDMSAADHERLALAREFRLLASLRHPHIISVLDYGFDHLGRCHLVMEYLDEALPLTQACLGIQPKERNVLLSQLMQALRYLHSAGVMHHDLKPDNVLVVERGGTRHIKLVDFGLATQLQPNPKNRVLAGTAAYLAPELAAGKPWSKASDIYALGVICYLLCSGKHPFPARAAGAPGTATPDDLVDLEALPLDPAARELIAAMLAFDPADRPRDVRQVLKRWCAANGLDTPHEPLSQPDGLVRASRFVGREPELHKLSDALDAALRQRGSAWVVTGASGVGKSRLLAEAKAAALVRGMLVLSGQAQDGGGNSFALWRNVLREVALYVSLSPLEASVVGALVEDLDQLLERSIEAAVPLAGDGNLRRLARTVQQLFERLDLPVLLLLEDVHWASPECVALLDRMVAISGARPVVLLASARSELRPPWLDHLDGAYEMRLYPFADDLVSAMCESMLGQTGANPAIAAPVAQASGGNALFVVEMLRSVAEERQGRGVRAHELIEQSAELTPEALLKRRIARVPGWARHGLEVAAVAGRQLDQAMLAKVVHDVPSWLRACGAAGVLDVVDDQWRFSHDRIREEVLAQLPDQTRRQLHGFVADALEGALGKAAPASVMAYHRDEAGDIGAAVPYLLNAAEQALLGGALSEAQQLADRVLSHAAHWPVILRDKARARRILIDTSYALSEPQRSLRQLRIMLEEVGLGGFSRRDPSLTLLVQLINAPRTKPIKRVRQLDDARLWRAVLGALGLGFRIHILHDEANQALRLLLLAHNVSRSLGLADKTATTHCGLAYALSMTPLRRFGHSVLAAAGKVIEEHRDNDSLGLLLEARGMVAINVGQWRDAGRHFTALEQHAARIGDERKQCLAAQQNSVTLQARGELAASQAKLDGLRNASGINDDVQLQCATCNRRGWLAVYRGQFDQAIEWFDRGLSGSCLKLLSLALQGGLALSLWLAGKRHIGEHHALASLGLLGNLQAHRLSGYAGFYPVPAVTHVLLSAYRAEPNVARRLAAQTALKRLERYSRQFPMGTPCYLRLSARYERWRGLIDRARELLIASVASARSYGMHLDEAMATLELAYLPHRDPQLREQARRAVQELHSRGAQGCFSLLGRPPDQADTL